MPLETVRGVYEKLSREAVEAQLMRPLPGRRIQQEHDDVTVDEGRDVDAGSSDVTAKSADDDVSAGQKSVIQRTVAWTQNGRAVSAPTTPVHRPLAATDHDVIDRDVTDHDIIDRDVTDHDVTDDELPQRGLTQALVAQWRELEERARADLMAGLRVGTSRSRSLSGLALRRGESPSPSRRDEPGRSGEDDGDVESHDLDHSDVGEQGRSGLVRQSTVDVEQRREGDEEDQLPPPLMTQYMLAKFRDMEAETQIIAGLQTKDKKVTIHRRLCD